MKTPMRMMTTDAMKIRMLIQPGICRHHQAYISTLNAGNCLLEPLEAFVADAADEGGPDVLGHSSSTGVTRQQDLTIHQQVNHDAGGLRTLTSL